MPEHLHALLLTAATSLACRALLALTFGNDRHYFYAHVIEQVMFVIALVCWAERRPTRTLAS